MSMSKFGRFAGVGALCLGGLALLPASAEPGDPKPPTPSGNRAERPRGEGPGAPGSEWREKYRQELREHPRLARSLVSLHETKEYLEKAPNDFGGHKAAAIKSCEDAIKELEQALKFDEKHEERRELRRGAGEKPAPPEGQADR